MLKAFCDGCSKPCDPSANATRRFERLTGTLGFEVIPIIEGKPSQHLHICDNCIFNMLWLMGEQMPGTGLATRRRNLIAREETAKAREEKIKRDQGQLDQLQELLDIREKKLKEQLERVNDETIAKYQEEIDALKAKLVVVEEQANHRIKIAVAQARQEAEDRGNYPEYGASVAIREARRRS